MARMVWVAIGAAGGIYAYRKVTQVVDDARGRSLVGNVNAATATATNLVERTKTMLTAPAAAADPPLGPEGSASTAGARVGASRLRSWIPPKSDDASSPSSPSGATPRSPAPR